MDMEALECPICFEEMKVEMAHYADGELPTAICSECGFESPVKNLQDEETKTKMINYRLRLLLGQIAQGERARKLINLHPLFPFDREEQLLSLMANKIPAPIDYPTNQDLNPLNEEDIEAVRQILNL